MDLKEREALGDSADTHWYYVSKAQMVARLLPEKTHEILDVGAGVGWFSRWFVDNGYAHHATCVDPGYEAERTENRGNGQQISYVRSICHSDADVVLLMDVLEHVDDDIGLLKEYWGKTRPGATFVITVPAFEFLWSAHDEYLDHRRRYTCARLAETIAFTGTRPEKMHYFFASIFPIAAALRFLRRKQQTPSSDLRPALPAINTLLTRVLGVEAKLSGWNRLGGLSVVAVLRKPDL